MRVFIFLFMVLHALVWFREAYLNSKEFKSATCLVAIALYLTAAFGAITL